MGGPRSYSRTVLSLQIPSVGVLAATGAVNLMLSKTLGFACELERIDVVTTATASVAGSRVLNVRRGNASGTIVLRRRGRSASSTPASSERAEPQSADPLGSPTRTP
jgi:hypothetical protein